MVQTGRNHGQVLLVSSNYLTCCRKYYMLIAIVLKKVRVLKIVWSRYIQYLKYPLDPAESLEYRCRPSHCRSE